jgi:hypothetical protein
MMMENAVHTARSAMCLLSALEQLHAEVQQLCAAASSL